MSGLGARTEAEGVRPDMMAAPSEWTTDSLSGLRKVLPPACLGGGSTCWPARERPPFITQKWW
eukprot:4275690-Pleurochrysis_carterae.AAC.2